MPPASRTPQHALSDEIRTRYLNYSLSVITSRALPDVRDGLKPSQRRILVAMRGLSLWPDAKFSKCAKICGETMGNYHPHGDLAIYATLVRMAQPFAMRHPLVDGQGNFGSLDGDNAAAMRYTEARLSGIAMELLRELGQDTVDWRPTYDGRAQEPVVLPARFPQLLVNGSSGIAVGMATSIPPHNLREVTEALLALLANPDVSPKKLAGIVKGPDFPTGGLLLNSHEEIREIYRTGQGVFKIRGEYEVESGGRGKQFLVLTSIPYGVNKSQLVEKIGAHIAGKKVPQLVDVRDESTDEVRVVCELRPDAAPEVAAAYLYKHTDLQSTFPANLTCLIPTPTPGLLRPERLALKGMLEHYLDFRVAVVRRRFAWELRQLEARIHVLEGFAKIFDALDEAIKIIRKSDGKEDAALRLMKRFGLDDVQADAILETKLYKLARTEIQKLLDELAEKEKDAKRIRGILKSKERLAAEVRTELQEVARAYGDDRRTKIGEEVEETPFDPEAYIVREDAFAVLTRDGRTKRQGSVKTAESIRTREGDAVIAVVAGATTEPIVYCSNLGSAYVMRMADLPASTGHGEPIQTIFKFGDGERAVALFSLDPRFRPPMPARRKKDDPEGPHLLVVTKRGYGFRFSLAAHAEPTTRGGRRYARVGEGDEILGVVPVTGEEAFVTATKGGRVLLAPVEEVPILAGAGRGVILHKVAPGDEVIGFGTVLSRDDAVVVEKSTGGEARITARSYRVASRAGKGFELTKRGEILRVLPRPISVPQFEGNGHARTSNGPEGASDG